MHEYSGRYGDAVLSTALGSNMGTDTMWIEEERTIVSNDRMTTNPVFVAYARRQACRMKINTFVKDYRA